MKSFIDITEIVTLLGLTFSFALLVEWLTLQGFFYAMSVGLKPAIGAGRQYSPSNSKH